MNTLSPSRHRTAPAPSPAAPALTDCAMRMPPRRRGHWHRPAEILEILDAIDTRQEPLREACAACQITEPTYYRWLKMRGQLVKQVTREERKHERERGTPPRFIRYPAHAENGSGSASATNGAASSHAVGHVNSNVGSDAHGSVGNLSLAGTLDINFSRNVGSGAHGNVGGCTGNAFMASSHADTLRLREVIVALTMENQFLRRTNEALAASLSPDRA